MNRKFKVGDKVATYTDYERRIGRITGLLCVTSDYGESVAMYEVMGNECNPYAVHEKAMRRLKKKEPKYYYVNVYDTHLGAVHLSKADAASANVRPDSIFLPMRIMKLKEVKDK